MINKISDFFLTFKSGTLEANKISEYLGDPIKEFAKYIKNEKLDLEFEDNFFTILGYSLRLDDVSQRLFFTFQEAIYALDLDRLMKNEESKKLNSIVYILVLDEIIKEYDTKIINEELKEKALNIYKRTQEKQAAENKKYHMYQN